MRLCRGGCGRWVVLAWLVAMVQPTRTLFGPHDGDSMLVDVLGKHATRWPCCAPGSTVVFASVVGAATPGYFAIMFDRPMHPRDDLLWYTQFEIFDGQSLALSSSEGLSLPPVWAHGYLVRSGGILSLTRLSMGGDVRVQAAASLNISGCVFSGRHSLYLEGGHVHISDSSELKAVEGLIELGHIASFTVLNSTVHMAATVAAGGPTGASIVLVGSEFQHYASWYQSTAAASTRTFADLTITLEEARSELAGMPPGIILGTVQSDDLSVTCARTGWVGWDCLEDFDECVDDQVNPNGGCHQICVNIPGSHRCECRDGYQLVAGSATRCEDIDECALQGCVAGHLARDCRGANMTIYGGVDRCEQLCTNFEGTFQCSCDPGLIVKGNDAYSCHDLDECMDEGVWGDPCQSSPHATCDNIYHSVQCVCDEGYEVNRTSTAPRRTWKFSDTGGEVLFVVRDGDETARYGNKCLEVVPEPEPEP